MERQASIPSENPLAVIAAAIESKWGGIIINFILLPLLCIAALVLPPISAVERIVNAAVGYKTFSDKTGGSVVDPDGTRIDLLPEGMDGKVRLALKPVPRDVFLRGEAGTGLQAAAEQFPSNLLVMKSPFYQIKFKGNEPNAVLLYVPIPNESEPYNTLDLYTWDGQSWQWLPSHQIIGEEVLEARLDFLPRSVVVVQTHPVRPYFSTNITPRQRRAGRGQGFAGGTESDGTVPGRGRAHHRAGG